MNEADFIAKKHALWDQFKSNLTLLGHNKLPSDRYKALPAEFRQLCADLAIARKRMYSKDLVDHLNELVILGNRKLHQSSEHGVHAFMRLVTERFPRAFREEWRLYVFCSLSFWIPFGLMMAAAFYDFEWIERILGPEQMMQMDMMYGKGTDMDEAITNEFGSRFDMFGHYILNNVGIDFKTFAGGALAGVGAMLVLLFNGVFIGAAAGYCTVMADPEKFWYFVCGHSAPELVGMLICGMAGMRVGLSWLRPGRLTRAGALTASARTALPLLLGGALLTAIAAPIEAFWSSQPLDHTMKLVFGLGLWVLLHVFLFTSGRERDAA